MRDVISNNYSKNKYDESNWLMFANQQPRKKNILLLSIPVALNSFY